MKINTLLQIRTKHLLFFLILFCGDSYGNLLLNEEFIKAHGQERHIDRQSLKSYLLPQDHLLQSPLQGLFHDRYMFKSAKHFKRAGFNVKLGHRSLMVGSHSTIPYHLIKKFSDKILQTRQLENYIKRIEGAKVLREYIKEHNFKHLIVPEKWLYKLPSIFPHQSFVLVVEKMNIYDWDDPNGEAKRLYYNMDIEVLTELCTILHDVGGCDAFPRNQPFTHSGKIAFVDTEHVGKLKGHFHKHIIPALNKEMQAYAIALWEQLEEEKKTKNKFFLIYE